MSYSLSVENLTVSYSRRNNKNQRFAGLLNSQVEQVDAVRKVSFAAEEGEIIGILGSNGAGKSTLLAALAQQIRYEGVIRSQSRPRLIRLDRSLPLTFTGRQQADLIIRSLVRSSKQAGELLEGAIYFADLGAAIDAPLRTYSKGMKSRLTFAALTIGEPDIVLIDEALAVGDLSFVRKAARRIRDLADGSTTVLICDHNVRRIRYMCNRALVLEKGVVKADRSVDEAIAVYEERAHRGIPVGAPTNA